jgi:NADH-quinone oxidoreductase subunit C
MDNLINSILEKTSTTDKKEFLDTLIIEKNDLVNVCKALKENEKLKFDFLMCLSGVDYKEYFEVVYHLYSMEYGYKITLKVKINHQNPEVDSVSFIWKTANWHEREAYDLLGIKFNNHPDLRRILLPSDWSDGYPLRKDYTYKPDKYD